MWSDDERTIIARLESAIRNPETLRKIDLAAARVEQQILDRPDDVLAWEPLPLEIYEIHLPPEIRSSWVFVLRADTITGAERHPNSHQRMMSYRGSGDFQTMPADAWNSNYLVSELTASLEERWISIPPDVWHQGVVPAENWVVVSFHTVPDHQLIEERPSTDAEGQFVARHYVSDPDAGHHP